MLIRARTRQEHARLGGEDLGTPREPIDGRAMTCVPNLAEVGTFSLAIEQRADGHYVLARTAGAFGDEAVDFGPMDADEADELAADFRSTCQGLGGIDISPGRGC